MSLFGKKKEREEEADQVDIEIVQPEEVPPSEASGFEELLAAQLLKAFPSDEPPDIDRWAEGLKAEEWDDVREAAVALCRVGDRRGLEPLTLLATTTIPQASGGPSPDMQLGATIALVRVMLEPSESILESGLNMNAGLTLQYLVAEHPDGTIRAAASWGLRKIPRTGGAAEDEAPIGHLTRWHTLRSATAVRAGRIHLPEDQEREILETASQLEFEEEER